MFVDQLQIDCIGGKGGDGLVHFAKRKYQAFAGPDGGDGGHGGAVVLVGQRDVDSLYALRLHVRRFGPFKAPDGKPGGPNLMIGGKAVDLELPVPLGTIAYYAGNHEEVGAVLAGGERLLLTAGGRGGRGNTKFATATVQAPKKAEVGKPGMEYVIDLRYRIYADTMLLEPLHSAELLLLPQLAKRGDAELDLELYQRKPRWLRYQHDYLDYDIAFVPLLSSLATPVDEEERALAEELGEPLEAGASAVLEAPLLEQLYWAQHAVVNLLPLGAEAGQIYELLHARLMDIPLRRMKRLVVLSTAPLFETWTLETDEGQAEVLSMAVDPSLGDGGALAAFCAELTGGVVV